MKGQEKLLASHLLIIGAGALGGTSAMYAAGSGVGNITVVDFDTVDISNLQRQVFYTEQDAGLHKVTLLKERIESLNSDCKVTAVCGMFNRQNAEALIAGADIVIDAADNPETTYLIESECVRLGKPYITAGVAGYSAQLMVHMPGGVNFSELFPRVDSADSVLPCAFGGVFGPLTGVVASLQAGEAVKYLGGDKTQTMMMAIDLRSMAITCYPL